MMVFVIVVVQVLKRCCRGLKPGSSLKEALKRKHEARKKLKKKSAYKLEMKMKMTQYDFDEDIVIMRRTRMTNCHF